MVLLVYLLVLAWGRKEELVRGASFLALVTGNVFLISSFLSLSQPFYVSVLKNRAAILLLLAALLLVVCVYLLDPSRDLFKVSLLGWCEFSLVLGCTLFFLFLLESTKRKRNKKSRTES